jgi:hypothetical protein
MTFTEAYEQMKKGKTVRRYATLEKCVTAKIVNDRFVIKFDGAVDELWPEDLNTTDWEVVE